MTRVSSRTIGWSCQLDLWRELQQVGKNRSWRSVELDSERSHLIPLATGVYLICARPPIEAVKRIGTYAVIYAGQVKSPERGLRTRFLEHIHRPNPKLRMYMDCFYPNVQFWFTLASDQSGIDELEGLLIDTFNPPCNSIRAPGSSAIKGRLGTPRRFVLTRQN